VLYRRNENPIVEHFLKKGRERHAVATIHKDDIRSMIRSLKAGHIVWFAFDQNYGHKGSVFSPFFGVPAATNTATSRLAKITGCSVVPFFAQRNAEGIYELIVQPALNDFPSESEQADTDRLNILIEEAINKRPSQYLWMHRRFKDMPEGGNRYEGAT
jgi:KDO2-lipid IV(A) lauroyltransferase